MKKRNPVRNTQARKAGARSKYLLLAAVCGVIFVASLFFAARQHFSSIEYSIKNAKLRKQIEELEYNKRSLQLTREISLSPAEIKKSAKKLGLIDISDSVTPALPINTAAVEAPKSPKTAVSAKPAAEVPKLVQKTVQSSPLVAMARKTEKKDPLLRDRKVQTRAAAE
jgi:predicted nucleic acid-binding protein